MAFMPRLLGGLRGLFRKTRVEQELDAELREFLEAAVENNMRAGLSHEDALRAARIEMGSVEAVKDRVRDAGWESVAESVWQDVRYGCRTLRRSPVFATIAIAILALGIGANTAMFSLLNAIMLRRLPVQAPEELVELTSRYPGEPRLNGFSWKVYEYFRDRNHVFSDVIGLAPAQLQIRRDGLETDTVLGEYVVGTFFPVLGLQPAVGRLIGPEDARPGAAPVAVVSWPYWKKYFNGEAAVLGKQILVNGGPATIVGVTPRAFSGVRPGVMPVMWLPVTQPTALGLIARLRPGVSIDQARAEMSVLHRWRIEEIARTSRDPQWLQAKMEVDTAAAGFSALRDRFATPLQVLLIVAALLLLIACTNVASMLLARGASRRREMAVRVSLGAGRFRIARQVLTESLLLSVAGSALGVLLAYFGADALVRLMTSGRQPPGWPQHLEIHTAPDLRVLSFTAAIALLTGVLFGLAPAWSAFRSAPVSALREIGSAGENKARRVFGNGLVVVQVALSVILLSAAALFVGHLSNLRNVDLGFRRESVLLVTLNPQGSGYDRHKLTLLYQDLLGRLQAIPGVRSATLSAVTPIDGGAASRFATVEGYEEKPEDRRRLSLNWTGPRYFETFGTPLLAGRDFEFADAGRPRIAIVNQAMAKHYFADRSPLGKHFTFENDSTPYEIVGVVADAKYADLHEPAPRTAYLNAFQEGRIASRFALRTSVPPLSIVGDVRSAVTGTLDTVKVDKVTTLADQVDASIVTERVIAMLSSIIGGLGSALATIGLYGLLAYTVARRVNEIGVRMALGATERDVTRMVLRGALGLVCAGLVVGAPIALWSRHVAASLVQNLPASNALPIAFAALAMIAMALLAAYLPARRAARVRPMDALRHS
jgi:putative ABC transport system permease protein